MSKQWDLFRYHRDMKRDGLVVGTQGNISVRTPTGICIKPSGLSYMQLLPGKFVDVDMDGTSASGGLRPSTDTESHLVIYRAMPKVQAIVHTHSTFATAFAACGLSIPVYLTEIADEFGRDIPCSMYADIGGTAVGQEVVDCANKSGVVLIRNHGLFAYAESVAAAYKKALMAENAARTVFYARQLGTPIRLTSVQTDTAYKRYHTSYGQ